MNKALLRSIMVLNGDTYQTLSEDMKMEKATFSRKINSSASFTKKEMQFIREKYNLTADQFIEMFFTDTEKKDIE